MVDVMSKRCKGGCGKIPIYNYPGQKKALYCNSCRMEGMVNVQRKECLGGCGTFKAPIYNYPFERKGRYCKNCKLLGMIDVMNKRCLGGCGRFPSCNYAGNKKRLYCNKCKLKGMIDIINKRTPQNNNSRNFNHITKTKNLNNRLQFCNKNQIFHSVSYSYKITKNISEGAEEVKLQILNQNLDQFTEPVSYCYNYNYNGNLEEKNSNSLKSEWSFPSYENEVGGNILCKLHDSETVSKLYDYTFNSNNYIKIYYTGNNITDYKQAKSMKYANYFGYLGEKKEPKNLANQFYKNNNKILIDNINVNNLSSLKKSSNDVKLDCAYKQPLNLSCKALSGRAELWRPF
jgi:hypothetical protein